MDRFQKWFEQLAGISREERRRWEIAQRIYFSPRVDIASLLQKPACWRRKSGMASGGIREALA
ncbi:MAG TPA: hypothetical protein PLS67_01220 [Accumulibacter sp.]|jgi:hypothetical protein|nr:hypothetical protein [Accumulibacter sp.]HQC79124.1 hypothetical protein [Accumulibacter sp.]